MILSLVGMPGSGKSTAGRQLARRLGLPFLDSDQLIEQRLGCSIREYFAREGEAAFRDVEERVIGELVRATTAVVATGGGAVLREAIRGRRRENHSREHGRCQLCRLHDALRSSSDVETATSLPRAPCARVGAANASRAARVIARRQPRRHERTARSLRAGRAG